jgi:hypothetical protein
MTVLAQVGLSGTIDRTAFETAIRMALARHPLLRAVVKGAGSGRERWHGVPDPSPLLDWASAGTPLCYPVDEHLDLSSEVGLRIWVRQGTGSIQWTMQIHHSCCDGMGAWQFIGDVLALYGQLLDPDSHLPRLVELDPGRLRVREEVMRRYFDRGIRSAFSVLSETFKNCVLQRPSVLHPPAGKSPARHPPRQIACGVSHTLDEAESRQLGQLARKQDVTLNDLLVRDLFLTLYDWNRAQKPDDPGGWLRIGIPINLRGREDVNLPAANLMSMVFLNQRARDCIADRAGELLKGIRQQMQAPRIRRLGSLFIVGVAGMRAARVLHWFQTQPLCLSTVVFRNLGELTRRLPAQLSLRDDRICSGGLVVEEVSGRVPLRPLMRAAFLAHTYAGRLTLSVNADPSCFSPEDSRRLLLCFVDHLRESAANG